jgi:hypothetical protein
MLSTNIHADPGTEPRSRCHSRTAVQARRATCQLTLTHLAHAGVRHDVSTMDAVLRLQWPANALKPGKSSRRQRASALWPLRGLPSLIANIGWRRAMVGARLMASNGAAWVARACGGCRTRHVAVVERRVLCRHAPLHKPDFVASLFLTS